MLNMVKNRKEKLFQAIISNMVFPLAQLLTSLVVQFGPLKQNHLSNFVTFCAVTCTFLSGFWLFNMAMDILMLNVVMYLVVQFEIGK